MLVVSGLEGPSLGFTDHPDRLVSTVPNAELAELVAGVDDPLNATLVAKLADGEEEVAAVVTLFGAIHDETAKTITYRVNVLAEAETVQLAELLAAPTEKQTFAVGHLFIDGAPYEPGIKFDTRPIIKIHQHDKD